jgi:FAD/FMN-containing dehydrogenase
LLLGARAITAYGDVVRMGARVVKSVAGYDLHKLLVGSFGTLGVIVEATLKVAPCPETERTVIARFAGAAAACDASAAIARSNLFPTATTLHDFESARRVGGLLVHCARDRWHLAVRCGGNRANVAHQADRIRSLCLAAGAESTNDLDFPSTKRAWSGIRELGGGALYPSSEFLKLKIAALPSETPALLDAARRIWPTAELTAHAPSGIVYANVAVDREANDATFLTYGFESLSRSGWYASVLSSPPTQMSTIPEPPQPQLPVKLIRAVKAALDPDGVLDPGRMPGGV